MLLFTHQIGEKPIIVREDDSIEYYVRIRRVSDAHYFDIDTEAFVDLDEVEAEDVWIEMGQYNGSNDLKGITLDFLPKGVLDLLFEYRKGDEFLYESDGFERRQFGKPSIDPDTCVVFGTILDVSGKPVAGQRVDAFLQRTGFFTDKSGLVGFSSSTLTDSAGYFELPLVQGTDVRISIPAIGFVTAGKVPFTEHTELSHTCLLRG